MRRLLVVSVSVFVLACGGDSSDDEGGLSGTVGGRSFSPVEVRAIPAGTGGNPCTVPVGGIDVSVGVKALAFDFTSYADACGDYASSQCRFHANAQNVTVILAKVNPTGTEPVLSLGTYTVTASPTTAIPDGTGLLTIAFGQALATDPSCAGAPSPTAQGGTVRLDQVTASSVTGHVSLTFEDGSSLEGAFSAPICSGSSPDICMLATAQALCTLPPACVQ